MAVYSSWQRPPGAAGDGSALIDEPARQPAGAEPARRVRSADDRSRGGRVGIDARGGNYGHGAPGGIGRDPGARGGDGVGGDPPPRGRRAPGEAVLASTQGGATAVRVRQGPAEGIPVRGSMVGWRDNAPRV